MRLSLGGAIYDPTDAVGRLLFNVLAMASGFVLGNGHCNRPAALDCAYESICERCGFFGTGTEFVPVLIRQRDHATDHGQPDRARLFTGLLDDLDSTT